MLGTILIVLLVLMLLGGGGHAYTRLLVQPKPGVMAPAAEWDCLW